MDKVDEGRLVYEHATAENRGNANSNLGIRPQFFADTFLFALELGREAHSFSERRDLL